MAAIFADDIFKYIFFNIKFLALILIYVFMYCRGIDQSNKSLNEQIMFTDRYMHCQDSVNWYHMEKWGWYVVNM